MVSVVADVDAVDAREGIHDGLTYIGQYRITHGLGNDFNRPAGLYADAVGVLHLLGGDDKSRHNSVSRLRFTISCSLTLQLPPSSSRVLLS